MPIVEPVKVLTVDQVPLNVADLSSAVQQLVLIFDDWNQKEADARSELMMVSAAKDTLSRQIVQQIRADVAAAEAATKPTEAAPVADVTPVGDANVPAVEVANDDSVEGVVVSGDSDE